MSKENEVKKSSFFMRSVAAVASVATLAVGMIVLPHVASADVEPPADNSEVLTSDSRFKANSFSEKALCSVQCRESDKRDPSADNYPQESDFQDFKNTNVSVVHDAVVVEQVGPENPDFTQKWRVTFDQHGLNKIFFRTGNYWDYTINPKYNIILSKDLHFDGPITLHAQTPPEIAKTSPEVQGSGASEADITGTTWKVDPHSQASLNQVLQTGASSSRFMKYWEHYGDNEGKWLDSYEKNDGNDLYISGGNSDYQMDTYTQIPANDPSHQNYYGFRTDTTHKQADWLQDNAGALFQLGFCNANACLLGRYSSDKWQRVFTMTFTTKRNPFYHTGEASRKDRQPTFVAGHLETYQGNGTYQRTDVRYANTDRSADQDGDQVPDYLEPLLDTSPILSDSDGDGLTDGQELEHIANANFGPEPFEGMNKIVGTDPAVGMQPFPFNRVTGITGEKIRGRSIQSNYPNGTGKPPILTEALWVIRGGKPVFALAEAKTDPQGYYTLTVGKVFARQQTLNKYGNNVKLDENGEPEFVDMGDHFPELKGGYKYQPGDRLQMQAWSDGWSGYPLYSKPELSADAAHDPTGEGNIVSAAQKYAGEDGSLKKRDDHDNVTQDNRIEVGNTSNLSYTEKQKVKDAILADPDLSSAIDEPNSDNVTVNTDGTATVHYKDGSTGTIPADNLVHAVAPDPTKSSVEIVGRPHHAGDRNRVLYRPVKSDGGSLSANGLHVSFRVPDNTTAGSHLVPATCNAYTCVADVVFQKAGQNLPITAVVSDVNGPSANYTITPGAADKAHSTVKYEKTGTTDAFDTGSHTVGDGFTVVYSPKDSFDNPVDLGSSAVARVPSVDTAGHKDYTFTKQITGANAGSYTAAGEVNKAGQNEKIDVYNNPSSSTPDYSSSTFNVQTGDPDAAHSSITVPASHEGATVPVTATIRDKFNNPNVGKNVTVAITQNGKTTTIPATVKNDGSVVQRDGSTPVTFTAGQAGIPQTVAVYNGDAATGTPILTTSITPSQDPAQQNVPVFTGSKPSTATITSGTKKADGHEAHTVTVKLFNKYGSPITGQSSHISVAVTEGHATVGSVTEDTHNAGTYTVNVTSTTVGTAKLQPKFDSTNIGSALTAQYVTPQADAHRSTVSVDAGPKVANDSDVYTVTVNAKDANNNPLGGLTLTPSADPADGVTISAPQEVAGHKGTYTFTVKSSKAGNKTISVTAGGVKLAQTVTTAFTAGAASSGSFAGGDTSFTSGAPVTGTHAGTVTLTDSHGNPVAKGTKVWVKVPGQANPIAATVGDNGAVQIPNFTPSKVKDNAIKVYPDNGGHADTTHTLASKTITITPGAPSAAHTDLVPSSTTPVTGSTVTFTGTVKDAAGNPVPSAALQLVVPNDNGQGTRTIEVTTDAHGNIQAKMPSDHLQYHAGAADKAQTVTLQTKSPVNTLKTVTITPAKDSHLVGVPVVNNAAPQSGSYANVDSGNKLADGKQSHTITVTLKDAYGTPVKGAASKIQLSTATAGYTSTGSSANIHFGTPVEGENGTYTVPVTATKAGTPQVTVKYVNGSTTVTLPAADSTATTAKNTVDLPFVAGMVDAAHTIVTVTSPSTTGDQSSVAAGTPITITVTPKDAHGNATGLAGNPNTITVTVPGVAANGGRVTLTKQKDGSYKGTATPTKTTTGSTNNVTFDSSTGLSGKTHGLTVTPGAVDASHSTLKVTTADHMAVPAAGVTAGTPVVVTYTPQDTNNNKVTLPTGSSVTVTVPGQSAPVTLTKQNDGTFTATVTPSQAGNNTITSQVTEHGKAAVAGPSATVKVTPAAASSGSFTGVPTTVTSGTPVADGHAGTVTLTDSHHNPVSKGTKVWVKVPGQADPVETTVGDNGTVQIPGFTPAKSNDNTITVYPDNNGHADMGHALATKTVTVNPGAPATNGTMVTLTPSSETTTGSGIPVENTGVTVGANVKDAAGNTVAAGTPVTVVITPQSGQPTTVQAQTAANGKLVLTSDHTTPVTFTAGNNGQTTTVTLYPQGHTTGDKLGEKTVTSGKNGSLVGIPTFDGAYASHATAGKNNAVADGKAQNTITVTLTDKYGTPVKGKASEIHTTATNGATAGTVVDNNDGTYTIPVTSTTAGDSNVTVTYGQAPSAKVLKNAPVAVHFASGTVDPSHTSVTVETAGHKGDVTSVAAGTPITITVVPQDAHGNKTSLTGNPATITVCVPGVKNDVTLNKQTDGSYKGTATPGKLGASDGHAISFKGNDLAGKKTHDLTVTPAPASKVIFNNGQPVTAVKGSTVTGVPVMVTDQFGNPSPNGSSVYVNTPGSKTWQKVPVGANGQAVVPNFTASSDGAIKVASDPAGMHMLGSVPVTTHAGAYDPAHSTVVVKTPAGAAVPTTGSTAGMPVKVVFTPMDAHGNKTTLPAGSTPSVTVVNPDHSTTKVDLTKQSDGTYAGTVTPVKAGTVTVQTKVTPASGKNPMNGPSTTVKIQPSAPNAGQTTLTATPSHETAKGSGIPVENSAVTLGGVVKDAHGNTIPTRNVTVVVTTDSKQQVIPAKTDARGNLVARSNGQPISVTAGAYGHNSDVKLYDGDTQTGTALKTVHIMPGKDGQVAGVPVFNADKTRSMVRIDNATPVVANSGKAHTVTVTLKDKYNAPVAGRKNNIHVTAPSGVTVSPVMDHGDGTYTFTVKSNMPKNVVVNVNYMVGTHSSVIPGSPVTAAFGASTYNPDHSEVSVHYTQPNVGGTATITLAPKDEFGNPTTLPADSAVSVSVPDNSPAGSHTVKLTYDSKKHVWTGTTPITKAGTNVPVTSTVAGKTGPASSYTAQAGTPDKAKSVVTVTTQGQKNDVSSVSAGTPIMVSVTPKDQYGNVVTAPYAPSGADQITVTVPGSSAPVTLHRASGSDSYTATVTPTKPAQGNVMVINGALNGKTHGLNVTVGAFDPAHSTIAVTDTKGNPVSKNGIVSGQPVRIVYTPVDGQGNKLAPHMVKVTVGNSSITLQRQSDGTYMGAYTPQAPGVVTVTPSITDDNGHSTDGTPITINVRPVAPTVKVVNSNGVTGMVAQNIAEGSIVTARDPQGNVIGTGTVNKDGSFTIHYTNGAPANGTPVTVIVMDKNSGLTSDASAPVKATVTIPSLKLDPTNGKVVSGTTVPNGDITITYTDDKGVKHTVTVTADENGKFSVKLPSTAKDGSDITVTIVDANGNTKTITITADETNSIRKVVFDNNANDVTVFTDPYSKVVIGNLGKPAVADKNGMAVAHPYIPLRNGDIVTITSTDPAGNVAKKKAKFVPTNKPDMPVVEKITHDIITGTSKPGLEVDVHINDNDKSYFYNVGKDGRFTIQVDSPLKNGDRVVIVATRLDNYAESDPVVRILHFVKVKNTVPVKPSAKTPAKAAKHLAATGSSVAPIVIAIMVMLGMAGAVLSSKKIAR